jgi:uncharacterized protein
LVRFWDTSALIPLIIDEPWTPNARTWLEADPELVLWWGASIECLSALARSLRESRITPADHDAGRKAVEAFRDGAFEILAGEAVRARAGRLLGRHPLRAADALHLAAALTWCLERPSGSEFVCLDQRLRQAARAEGFDVLPASMR